MKDAPLMPRATAVWLVENTTLTFKQIANFCNIHEVEVQGIADGEVAKGIVGYNPIISGQLTKEEIELSSKDHSRSLNLTKKVINVKSKEKKRPKYTPISKRQNRPDTIYWLIKNYPNLSDGQISKIVGTTKNTISSIRSRTFWNFQNLTPKDPVALGLCSQSDLEKAVNKANRRKEREKKKEERAKKKEEKLKTEQNDQSQV